MKLNLWLTTSAIAMTWCGIAQAQAAPAADTSASTVKEVVITAERRSSNLQKTPVAASVLTGADLVAKGVVTVDALQTAIPSVTIQNFGQGNDFNIRGIGKEEQNSGTTVGVVTYRDGVPTFPGYFQDEPFYDIASVEVLRGPQGTFAGLNATGGAVFVNEVNPSLASGYHGYVLGQYGNYNDIGAQGAVNLPISDTLAARVAFNTEYRDSFYSITGPYTGHPGKLQEDNARLSLLWQPTDAFKVTFKTDFNYIDQGGYPADPVGSKEDPFHITNNAPNEALDRMVRSVLTASYRFSNGVTLKSITGYQHGITAFDGDADGTSGSLPTNNLTLQDLGIEQIWSEELNLVSPDTGPLTWIAGLFAQSDNTSFPTGTFTVTAPPLEETLNGANPKQTEAVFGQVSYNLPHGFQLQVGARYSDSKSTNNAVIGLYEQFGPALFPLRVLSENQSEEDSKVTGKVALNWTLDRDNFLYAFVATGHKAGGVNTPTLLTPVPESPNWRPEDVTDYEIGWKSTSFDGHLKTQLGAYYNDYNNFQVSIGIPGDPLDSTETNLSSTTKIYGVEAQGEAQFGHLGFDFGASVLHSELGDFTNLDPRTHALVDVTGKQQTYAPTFTFNIGAQYQFVLANDDTLTPRVNFAHIGSQWATIFENASLGDLLGERNLLTAQVAYAHGPWTLTAYGTNLTDDRYISAVNSGLRYEGAPRQFGIRAATTF